MLYLEDYLEMIENLPMEMRDRFTEMREMDLEVQNTMDSLEGRVKSFFKSCLLNQDKRQEWKDEEFRKIRQEYGKALDDADEKVQLANQIYDMVDRYLRKLDQELAKFKMELEADNAGITEVLERRSLEMDKPSSSVANNKSERRKAHSLGANKHHTKHTTTPGVNSSTEKVLSSLATEAARDMGGGGISLHHRNSTSSLSSASTSNGTGGSGVGGGVGGSGLGTSNAALTGGTTYANNPSSSGSSASASSTTHHSPAMTYNLGTNSNAAIAAAASKAIGATLGMSQGRRTASLKASYEAVTRNADLSKELFPTTPDPSLAPSPAGSLDTPSLSNTPTTKSRGHKKQKIGHLSHSSSSSALLQQELQSSAPATPAPTDGMALGDDMLGEDPSGNNWGYDPNEPRYCTCNDVSYGDMVGCDNSDCPIEWFHYGCVGLEQAPKGKWYCPQCSISMKRRGRK